MLLQAEVVVQDDNFCSRELEAKYYRHRLNICAGGGNSSDTCQVGFTARVAGHSAHMKPNQF